MQKRRFARKPLGHVDLDLCWACHGIWFDQYESAALTPGAVLELFHEIHDHRERPPRPIGDASRCPQCRGRLKLTHDIQRTNRIAYYRCAEGHGRFTTFFQFLREKNFVRSLSVGEIAQLRAKVAQVRCSSCGAPVALERDAQCGYCRAPVSILDADAVGKTIAELSAAEQRRQHVDPGAAMDAVLAGQRFERRLARIEGRPGTLDLGIDLVSEALDLLFTR